MPECGFGWCGAGLRQQGSPVGGGLGLDTSLVLLYRSQRLVQTVSLLDANSLPYASASAGTPRQEGLVSCRPQGSQALLHLGQPVALSLCSARAHR
jgi:hypothetical protein